jgi:hypothetical protein
MNHSIWQCDRCLLKVNQVEPPHGWVIAEVKSLRLSEEFEQRYKHLQSYMPMDAAWTNIRVPEYISLIERLSASLAESSRLAEQNEKLRVALEHAKEFIENLQIDAPEWHDALDKSVEALDQLSKGESVCIVMAQKDQANGDANAGLIASEPDLLDALTELLRVDDEWHGSVNSEMSRARKNARAAIAKSTGVQP